MTASTQKKFWQNFSKLYWEKKPILQKKFASPLTEITEEQIFLMLVKYSNYCRKIKQVTGFKFFLDGQRQHDEDLLQILPVKEDKSLLGYHHRMENLFPDYCLVCDELLQVSQNEHEKLLGFTENLFAHIGLPNQFAEMGLYLGNYRKTPFGVHVDGCGVFSFPVVGKKSFRLWEPSFVKKNPALNRAHSYSKFKKNSVVINAFPGDMTYWPSSAWHIAESDGAFSATWSLGIWVEKTHLDSLEESLRPLLRRHLQGAADETTVRWNSTLGDNKALQLPKEYLNSISKIKNICENELYDTFIKSWISHCSKLGFKTRPQKSKPVELTLQSRIQLKRSETIFWAFLKSESITVYAYRGTLFEAKNSIPFVKLIKALNSGKVCPVSDFLIGTKKSPDIKLLQQLSTAGAFISAQF